MYHIRMKYRFFGWLLGVEALVLVSLTLSGGFSATSPAPVRLDNRDLAQLLVLTDLAIWTEARYTRHPSQADFFSAFQDSPAALEHFPAGALSLPQFPAQPPITVNLAVKREAEDEPAS